MNLFLGFFSLALGELSSILIFPQLTINFIFFRYPIGLTLIQAIYSKILGSRPQGIWMGFMTIAGCLSRILGPICVSLIYRRFGTLWTFTFTLVLMVLPMTWLLLLKDRLYVKEINNKTIELEDQSKNNLKLSNNDIHK